MYNDLMDTIGFVGKYDKDVADGMKDELLRQQRNIDGEYSISCGNGSYGQRAYK